MNENNPSILPHVITPVSDAIHQISKHALRLNNFGTQFAKICLAKEL